MSDTEAMARYGDWLATQIEELAATLDGRGCIREAETASDVRDLVRAYTEQVRAGKPLEQIR